jgi:hypothetical protein
LSRASPASFRIKAPYADTSFSFSPVSMKARFEDAEDGRDDAPLLVDVGKVSF